MQINIHLNDDEPIDGEYQYGWSATIRVTTDDGRVVESDNTGYGSTVQLAINDLMAYTETHEILAPIFQTWENHDLPSNNADYVLVYGGLVQNVPGIPVFDLDVIEDAPAGRGDTRVQEALELRTCMIEHGSPELTEEIERINDYVRNYGSPAQISQIENTLVSDIIKQLDRRRAQVASEIKTIDDDLAKLKLAQSVTQMASDFPSMTKAKFSDWRSAYVDEGDPFEIEFIGAYDGDDNLVGTLDIPVLVEVNSFQTISDLYVSDANEDLLIISVEKCRDYANQVLVKAHQS